MNLTINAIESWELSEDGEKLFSADAVIDAYLKGKRDQLEQSQKAIIEKFESNLRQTSHHTEELISFLNSVQIRPFAAYLKVRSFDTFEVLVTLSERDFLSDEIERAYDYISNMEQRITQELYRITYHFTYHSENFNVSLLKSDGYFAKKGYPHQAE